MAVDKIGAGGYGALKKKRKGEQRSQIKEQGVASRRNTRAI